MYIYTPGAPATCTNGLRVELAFSVESARLPGAPIECVRILVCLSLCVSVRMPAIVCVCVCVCLGVRMPACACVCVSVPVCLCAYARVSV